jgi:hypothetical protein
MEFTLPYGLMECFFKRISGTALLFIDYVLIAKGILPVRLSLAYSPMFRFGDSGE